MINLKQGDCLELMKSIDDKSIDLILTDPPYGINYQSNLRKQKFKKIENDSKPFLDFIPQCENLLKENGSMFVFFKMGCSTKIY